MAQIYSQANPFTLRDFRQGRYTPSTISSALVPQNSVKHSQNVNFDTTVGSAVVRPGTTLVGSTVASGKTPLGLAEFQSKGAALNYMFAVFSGASNATCYYYSGSAWAATNKTALSNTKTNRFASLGGSVFMTNSTDGMFDAADHTFGTTNSIASASVLPSLVYRHDARLLCAGDPTYPSRVWFSSIIDPTSSPFITWNTDGTTGNWIDINPDDGASITAFAETSTFLLVFKGSSYGGTGMYRIDTVNKSADANNIFNVGAISQEAVTACQGVVYFFSGTGIYRTNGGFPELISRAGVQDIINAISQSTWASVAAGTDGFNVWWDVGNVTIDSNKDTQKTINNCRIKYSTLDQTWSVHSYANAFKFFCQYTDSTNGRKARGATTAGDVQTIDIGTTDNTVAINYELETQDLDFGDRAHTKQISDNIIVFTNNGADSMLQCRVNGTPKIKQITGSLNERVNYLDVSNLTGNFFNLRWQGVTSGTSPVFEGFSLQNVSDLGLTYATNS